jgi:Domain of unknown function (DUF4395)
VSLRPSTLLTPSPARQIDPRGQRFGAGVSAIVLAAAFLLQLPLLAVLVGVNLAVSAFFGTRLFLPGRAWPLVRRTLHLGPAEPEHEYPPRFAQAMGGTCIGLATIAFVAGLPLGGWLLTAAVAGLQTLLALTGICVGCRLYFLRWWVPTLFARLLRRAEHHRFEVGGLNRIA